MMCYIRISIFSSKVSKINSRTVFSAKVSFVKLNLKDVLLLMREEYA